MTEGENDLVSALRAGADCREDDDISGRGWSGARDARLLREHAEEHTNPWARIVGDIAAERARQDEKWGEQRFLHPLYWLGPRKWGRLPRP